MKSIEGNNRIYTLESESLNKPDSLSVSVHNTESAVKAQSVATARTKTTTIAKTDTEIVSQMPKDNSDPLKTFEYFKDDFIKEYPKVLEFHDGHMPMANYLSHYAKENIQAKQQDLLNTVKDEFSNILKDIGLKKDEIKQVLDHANKYDVEYSLPKVRQFLDYAEKNYNTLLQEQQVLAQGLINKKQDILNAYESKIPQSKELERKYNLIANFDAMKKF